MTRACEVLRQSKEQYRGTLLTGCYIQTSWRWEKTSIHVCARCSWSWAGLIHASCIQHLWRDGSYHCSIQMLCLTHFHQPYSTVMSWLWCSLSFSLLCSAIMSLRGLHSKHEHVLTWTSTMTLSSMGTVSLMHS